MYEEIVDEKQIDTNTNTIARLNEQEIRPILNDVELLPYDGISISDTTKARATLVEVNLSSGKLTLNLYTRQVANNGLTHLKEADFNEVVFDIETEDGFAGISVKREMGDVYLHLVQHILILVEEKERIVNEDIFIELTQGGEVTAISPSVYYRDTKAEEEVEDSGKQCGFEYERGDGNSGKITFSPDSPLGVLLGKIGLPLELKQGDLLLDDQGKPLLTFDYIWKQLADLAMSAKKASTPPRFETPLVEKKT